MKIATLGPVHPYRGGIVIYHTLLIHKLLEHHEVISFSFTRQYPGWLYPGRSDKDPSKKAPDFPVINLLDSINPLSWYKTARSIVQQKPDLLIIEWWVTFLAPALSFIARYCKRNGVKVLYIIHNVFPHEGGRIHRLLAYFALKSAPLYLTHTPEQERALLEVIPNAFVRTCPLPIYQGDEGYLTMDERVRARKQRGIPTDIRVLLFFGIVRAYKGLMVLLEAVSLLKAQSSPICLLVAGEFWEKRSIYDKAIARLGISDSVQLEDRYIPDEEVRQVFAVADVLVAPYTGGTQSGIIALARGFGIPLVMTDRSAAGMDLGDVDPQTIAPAGDAYALAQAILYCLDHPGEMKSNPDYSWKRVVETIEGLCK